MNPNKIFNSFAQNYSKDTGLVSTTARVNINNSSTSGFLKLSTARGLFDTHYSKSYLSDLQKTFYININILKQFLSSNKNQKSKEKDLNTLLTSVLEKVKKKEKILDKIKEKKSKILIDSQIIIDKKRKIEEKNFFYKNRVKEGEERIDNKEEYMKVLHKNTVNLKNFNRKKKYQSFSMFNFVEENNEFIKLRKDLNKVIENEKKNYKDELEENKQIKEEIKKEKEIDLIEKNNEEAKIKKISEKYKSKIKLMKLRVNVLRDARKRLNKEIKILKIGDLNNNIDNNKKEDEINDLDQIPLETSFNMKNSYMDFSVLNTQNFDDNKDISKIDMGNFSRIGIYDISIINQK